MRLELQQVRLTRTSEPLKAAGLSPLRGEQTKQVRLPRTFEPLKAAGLSPLWGEQTRRIQNLWNLKSFRVSLLR